MKIKSISGSSLSIPFNATFKHASAERASTQTFWVEARDENNVAGYGEGCPREYVTTENLGSAQQFLSSHLANIRDEISDIASLSAWVAAHKNVIDANPSAWAAIEMALIDLLGKREKKSTEELLQISPLKDRFFYTAVLGDASQRGFEMQLAHYLQAGFKHFKIKLSGDAARDLAKIQAINGADISAQSVRVDANNLWADADAAIHALLALNFHFFAVEEPLRSGDYQGMSRIASALNTRIILDESFLRLDQIKELKKYPDRWIINLRISKMGGLLRSLELANALRKAGLQIIIGAHVGETSLLTRAALTVANNNRDILLAQEGAFGTHLLEEDITAAPIMFGKEGTLHAADLASNKFGFGLDISQACLQARTIPIA